MRTYKEWRTGDLHFIARQLNEHKTVGQIAIKLGRPLKCVEKFIHSNRKTIQELRERHL